MHSKLDFRPVQIITDHVIYNSPYKYGPAENGHPLAENLQGLKGKGLYQLFYQHSTRGLIWRIFESFPGETNWPKKHSVCMSRVHVLQLQIN